MTGFGQLLAAGGFVPYAPGPAEAVDGAWLAALAYGTIVGLFVLYGASLWWRGRRVDRAVRALRRQVGSR